MPRRSVGRRQDQRCWLECPLERRRLTSSAHQVIEDLSYHRRQRHGRKPVYTYTASLHVEGYTDRHVVVEFTPRLPESPRVTVDGPQDSPHRYAALPGRERGPLCLWKPGDPPERVWQSKDGLLALFGLISQHLFKEAWYRENGPPWLGEEINDTAPATGSRTTMRARRRRKKS